MSRPAFENAIAVVMAFGGSTNAVLHLLAIAHEAGVPLELDDFNRIGARVPHLADVKPFGAHVMASVDQVGGVPVVMRALLDAGLLNGECLTVTGRTVAENLAELDPPDLDGKILHSLTDPIHPTGGITILRGSLAPEGAVVKSAGFDSAHFEGRARVFDGEQAAMAAIPALAPGDVVVIRYEGPPDWARTSCCSPTAASPEAPPDCASATWPPRPRTAGRSRWSVMATRSCWIWIAAS
jgi:dihydroxy-acid dehydratase